MTLAEQYDASQRYPIADLQWVHDEETNWDTSETMSRALIKAGIKHGLSVEFIDGLYFDQDK